MAFFTESYTGFIVDPKPDSVSLIEYLLSDDANHRPVCFFQEFYTYVSDFELHIWQFVMALIMLNCTAAVSS